MKSFAKIISLVFGLPWVFVLLPVVIWRSGVTSEELIPLAAIAVVFNVTIPLIYFMWAYKAGRISDLDITNRKERFGIMTVSIISFLVSLYFVRLVGNQLVFHMLAISSAFLIIAYSITLFWKISMHMGINMLSITLLNFLFDWKLLYLYAIIPLIYWSRRVLHKHTPMQLVLGAIVTLTVVLGGLRYFGYV